MDIHQDFLRGHCRLCCSAFQITSRHDYSKESVKEIIKDGLGADVTQDDPNIHPPSLCGSCYRKLTRWKKNKKRTPLNIAISEFAPHSDVGCHMCVKSEEPDFETQLKGVLAHYSDVTLLSRSNRWLILMHDDLGNANKILTVHNDRSWTVRVFGKLASVDQSMPPKIKDDSDIQCVLDFFVTARICEGNNFHLSESRLQNLSAYKHNCIEQTVLRHSHCPLLIASKEVCCGPCTIYRSTLAAAVKAEAKLSQAGTSRFTPYKYLSRKKIEEKLKTTSANKLMKRKIKTLETQVSRSVQEEGEELPEHQTQVFKSIINNNETTQYFSSLPDDSPAKILWQQQLKSIKTTPKRMRWHPAFLRLCIALHSKSSSAYNLLRKSGFIKLPHENTIFEYTHFTDTSPGFNIHLLEHAINEYLNDVSDESFKRNVVLLMDEMKIKSGLMFDSNGKLVGFTDMGAVNNELKTYEQTLKGEKTKLASHVLVLMARGLCSNFKCAFAYFPSEGITCDQLYSCAWEGVLVLESWGLCVRAITSDGASANRKFYNLCGDEHWTWNPYAPGRKVYFFADAPHLIKTVRNNFSNSGSHSNTRNLMFRGDKISWRHILSVYDWDIQSGSGLRELYKITSDHLHLTPSSRMRVSLATQVLSSTMANALISQGLPETCSTRLFIQMMDTFFDCMNVSTKLEGRKKRKPTLEPYTSVNDWRFVFLEEEFLSFLDEWATEGKLVPGITKSEKEKLCLSKTTLEGLVMTVKSFVALTKELLAEGAEYFLSEKLSQDPLEEYFGKQRGMGGRHENPDARQFGANMSVIQVAGSAVRASSRASVKRQSEFSPLKSKPLPKRLKKI